MGQNMPSADNAALTWLESHLALWGDTPSDIGLTSAQVTDLTQHVVNTRSAFTSVEAVRTDSKAQTVNYHLLATDMKKAASLMIGDIKNFALASQTPGSVYTAAGITPADARSPAPPPTQPAGMTAILNGDGSITINFKGTGPMGTVWEITRKLQGETSFTHIGHADPADKSYTDVTVPGTVSSASYIVRGVRGNESGAPSLAFTVQFGGSDGEAVEGNGAAEAA